MTVIVMLYYCIAIGVRIAHIELLLVQVFLSVYVYLSMHPKIPRNSGVFIRIQKSSPINENKCKSTCARLYCVRFGGGSTNIIVVISMELNLCVILQCSSLLIPPIVPATKWTYIECVGVLCVIHAILCREQSEDTSAVVVIIMEIEQLLAHCGDFGRYQMLLLALFCLINVLASINYYSQTIITFVPEHWWEDRHVIDIKPINSIVLCSWKLYRMVRMWNNKVLILLCVYCFDCN